MNTPTAYESGLPLLPADLSLIHRNGGRAFSSVSLWPLAHKLPVVGDRVTAFEGDLLVAAYVVHVTGAGIICLQSFS